MILLYQDRLIMKAKYNVWPMAWLYENTAWTLSDYAWIKPDHELKYRDPLIYIEQGWLENFAFFL